MTIATANLREHAHIARAREIRVLLVEGWSQTVRLARALARAGHAVTVMTANGGAAQLHHDSVHWLSAPRLASERFLAELDRIADSFDHVIPLTEAAMRRLWDAKPAWSGRIFPPTDDRQRQLVRDKHSLLDHCAARGVAVPRHCSLEEGIDEILDTLGLPLAIKAAIGAGGSHVRIVCDRAQLERAVAWAQRLGGSWIAQEWIDGPTFLVGGVFHEGEPLRLYAAEKLEQHPPRTGPAIRLRSVEDPALLALATRVFGELRWTGFASADVIRRPDGSYALLEVNPRLWGSFAAAASAGVDLFAPFTELLAGRVPPADLGFAPDDDCRIFPRYLLSPRYRNLTGIRHALGHLASAQGEDWRDPRFMLHLARRLLRLRGAET